MNSVAIIGGGITGLTAAFRLREKGIPATIYEASPRVGGVIQTLRSGGYLAEYGPNTLLETSPRITDLIRTLGLRSRCLQADPRAKNRYVVRGRKPMALPGSVFQFLTTKLFSASAKLRLFKEPFIGQGVGEESVGAFVERRLGREFLDYAIDPLVSGIYAGDPNRLSVQHAFPKVYGLEQKYGSLIKGQIFGARERKHRAEVSKATAPKLSFDLGLQVLPDTLHAHLGGSVLLNAPVSRVIEEAQGWSVEFTSGGQLERGRHSAVLFAGPAYRLPQLRVEAGGIINLSAFGEIHHPPVASVVLGFATAQVNHPLDGFGMLVPKVEGFNILGTVFTSSLFPNRAPAQHATLTSYLGGARNPSLARETSERLVELTLKDLATILGVTGRPTFQHVVVFQQAIPQYEVGYARFKRLLDEVEAAAPGFFLGGNYRQGPSLSDSILSGHDAADKIGSFVQSGQRGDPARASTPQPALSA